MKDGKESELSWSTGVLEYWKKPKPQIQLKLLLSLLPLLHHSIIPTLQSLLSSLLTTALQPLYDFRSVNSYRLYK
jgi:hypothetical protein